MRVAFIACLTLLVVGCFRAEELPGRIDRWSFHRFGGTLVGSPDLLTLKEIHLDTGTLTGKEVIVQGEVGEVGKHGTYLVLKDSSARLLVVLTDLDATSALLVPGGSTTTLRILGVIESGKKGMPFLRARSFSFTELEAGTVATKA